MPIKNHPASTLRKAGLNYIVLPPQIIQLIKNPLSLAIWCYLQSHSDGWICRRESIMNHFDVGRHQYDKAMKELRDNGLVWTEFMADIKTNRLTDRRIVCSNMPRSLGSDNQTQGKLTKTVIEKNSPWVGFPDSRAAPMVGPSDHLINTYKNIINTQRERDTDKFTLQADTMPSSALVESVEDATSTPSEFVFGAWAAFLGHNLGKLFSDDELQGAFIKWVGRAWNDFGGESAHFNKAVARLNRMPPRNAQKAP
jgi:hypothetical protein